MIKKNDFKKALGVSKNTEFDAYFESVGKVKKKLVRKAYK
jgi:hypothetical protein